MSLLSEIFSVLKETFQLLLGRFVTLATDTRLLVDFFHRALEVLVEACMAASFDGKWAAGMMVPIVVRIKLRQSPTGQS